MTRITERELAEAVLQERERRSSLIVEIAGIWTRSEALHVVLNRCAEALVHHLDAAFARIWTLNREENVLELQASAGLYTHLDGPHGRVPVGKLKIGLIAEERRPHLTNSVIGDPRVSDQEWARREGMVSFAGYPLMVEGRLLGVMAMFARRPLGELTLAALASVAESIANGIDRRQAEAVRDHRAAELQESQRISRIGSWEWTIATGSITWSEGLNHLLGRDRDLSAPSFKGLPAFYTPESWQRLSSAIATAVETGAAYDLEVEMIRPDGGTCWTTTRGESIRGAGGTVTKLRGTVHDISERKRAEENLGRLQNLHEAILNSAAYGIHGMDTDGRIVFENPAAAQMLGWEPAELVGRPAHETMHYKRADGTGYPAEKCQIYGSMRDGELRRVSDEVFCRKDGTFFPVEYTVTPLRGKRNEITGAVVVFTDITERKRAEAERERLMAAIEQAAEMVLITDAQGGIVYVNPAFQAVTGYTRAEILGRNPRMLKSGVHDDAYYRVLWKTISGGATWHGRMIDRKKDGTLFTQEMTISPVRDAAGVIASYVAVKRDITRDLALEAQLFQTQKMEGIGRLAGGVAHDFNNLLSVILGYTGLAMEKLRAEDPLTGDLEEVRKAGERAAALTRQLLAFSRKQVLQPESLDLNRVIGEIEKMLRRIIGEDIELLLRRAPDLGLVRADPGQIEQVVMNLVVNARDAMPQGGRLTIETSNVALDAEYVAEHATVSPGPYVLVSVSDTGIGMDDLTKSKIFEPFFTTKERGKGTGLGLSTVYGIVKQSGGTISFYSEPDRGTTFKVYLPRDLSATPPANSRPPAVRKPSRGTETVLVVDDEDAVRAVASRILTSSGYTVLTAAGGEEALLASARHSGDIQLLLTDVVMPRMGGQLLAREFSKTRPALKVLYMSGYTDDAIVSHGVLEAGTQFIGKPFSSADLQKKIREVLDSGL